MFDGVPSDQFHHFIASSRTSIPNFSTGFDHFYPPPPSSSLQTSDHHQTLEQVLHNSIQAESSLHVKINNDGVSEKERSNKVEYPSWSNDEVVALLKVRSSMEINWFPDFSWEHVSRKLAELGFRRRAEECKEKFEEESDHVSYNKNYRIFSELDEFNYPNNGDDHQEEIIVHEVDSSNKISIQEMEKPNQENQDKFHEKNQEMSEEVVKKLPITTKSSSNKKKRKHKEDKFEIFKGFCESIVNKMMAKQEEMHNKLIEDLLKRDEEKLAREEALKNSEMQRVKFEIEKRAQEQSSAGERQAIIIDFLKKFTSDQDQKSSSFADKIHHQDNIINNNVKVIINTNSSNSVGTQLDKGETSTTSNNSSMINNNNLAQLQNPNSNLPSQKTPKSHKTPFESSNCEQKGGMRWPKDQVLALINLRCKLSSTNNNNNSEGSSSKDINVLGALKGPLWERISQGMLELGYKRSAKRCKEKWENINKYFRKTKDDQSKKKKRCSTVESRTCPYFHQLSCLYSDGTLVAPTHDVQEEKQL